MSLPDFSRPSPIDGKYDVFLSFRGTDTRTGFTTNLYHALRQNKIHTFMDVDLLGEEIDHLFHVIEQSRMAVVIYSKTFASSRWCLQELDKILQHKKEKKILLTPIFYKVNIDEVKHLTGQTGEYLDKHVAEHGDTTVQTWRDVVTNFGRVSGLSYKDNDSWSEHEFIENVIGKIKKKLESECQQHSVDKGGQPEGMVADKQCFTYDEILKITNNLDKVIARGVYGDVYSGKLNDAAVAVKIPQQFYVLGCLMEGKDFTEQCLKFQCSLRHENLVSLLGYCFDADDKKMAFVFEFIENGDLRKHLSSGASPRVLTWKERLKIATDIAEGLKYLHETSTTSVGLGNLQTTDIVFDEKMTAKILLMSCKREQITNPYDRYITSIVTDAATSFPLVNSNQIWKVAFYKKVDLHCFARILYELVNGYAPPLMTSWQNFVIELSQGKPKVDSRLGGVINKIAVQKIRELAFLCAQMDDFTQPPITFVLLELNRISSIV